MRLLLSQDDSLRATQLGGLAGRATPKVSDQAAALFPEVSRVATRTRLPLVNLALPALRQMDAGQFSRFSQALQWLINSDGQVEMFEFVLQKIVRRHLDPQFNGARNATVQFYTLKPLVPDCAVVLSALATRRQRRTGGNSKSLRYWRAVCFTRRMIRPVAVAGRPMRHRTT